MPAATGASIVVAIWRKPPVTQESRECTSAASLCLYGCYVMRVSGLRRVAHTQMNHRRVVLTTRAWRLTYGARREQVIACVLLSHSRCLVFAPSLRRLLLGVALTVLALPAG